MSDTRAWGLHRALIGPAEAKHRCRRGEAPAALRESCADESPQDAALFPRGRAILLRKLARPLRFFGLADHSPLNARLNPWAAS